MRILLLVRLEDSVNYDARTHKSNAIYVRIRFTSALFDTYLNFVV